jgi:hypothetical protein
VDAIFLKIRSPPMCTLERLDGGLRGYEETIYKLHRMSIKTGLNVTKIVGHLGLEPAAEADVDNVLDQS